MSATIRKRVLFAAGAAATLALPAMAQAQADETPTQDYPACSATVTDHCIQREGGSHAGTHHAKAAHHKARKPKG